MDQLTPIPTPASQRWREFRISALPVVTFIAVVICIGILWQRYVFPSNIVAQVEATTATVISTVPGVIERLDVQRFQKVKKGDVVAVLTVAETNLLSASLEMVQADLGLMRARLEQGNLRNEQIYERERLAYLEQRVQLDVDRMNLLKAQAIYRVQEELFTNVPPLINSNQFNQALYTMKALEVKTKEMEQFLKEKEKVLPRLLNDSTNTLASIETALKAQQGRVLAASTNLILRAPMDGMITVVSNRVGERVMGGSPILTIAAPQAERIIAYMRQPLTKLPKPGDTLQVRRRTFQRQAATATVREVGTQLEPISMALQPAAGAPKVDLGLPFSISMPPTLALVPGEIVDIIYDQKN